VTQSCDLGPVHPEAHCRLGTEITDGDLDDVFSCWTAGFIFVSPLDPFSYLIAIAAGHAYCDGHFTENVCTSLDHSSVPEVANGSDDNCDGVGLGDEFCDGIDNDGDGRVDEDAGSCKLRFLAVPVCWAGTDADFETTVGIQEAAFLEASGLDSCQLSNVHFQRVLPSQLNVACTGTGSPSLQNIEAAVENAALPGIDLRDFDALGGFTDQDLDGSTRGATDTRGRYWGETQVIGTSRPDIVMAHEFGHVTGLDDEYCSSEGGADGSSACNSNSSINFLDVALACDPSSTSCCAVAFRNPNAVPGDYRDDLTPCAGEYNVCCLGNSAVADATASTLANDPSGRCVMSSSFGAEPRRYCQHCLNHLRSAGLTCDGRHGANQRILEVNGISDPGARPAQVTGFGFFDGRAGAQNLYPQTEGDVVVELIDVASSSLIARRGLTLPGTRDYEFRADPSFSLRIPLPDTVADNDPIRLVTHRSGTLSTQSTINGSPPNANAGPDIAIECTGATTQVLLDAGGSSDADGDTLIFGWTPGGAETPQISVNLAVGEYTYTVTVDDGLESTSDAVSVDILDTVAPTVELVEAQPYVVCEATQIEIPRPQVADLCSPVLLAGFVVQSTNSTLELPLDVSSGLATLSVGTHTIEWHAQDNSGNETIVSQTISVSSALHATSRFDLRDRAQLLSLDGGFAMGTSAGSFEVGSRAEAGTVLAPQRIFVRSFATVHGDALSGQGVDLQAGARVLGDVLVPSSVGYPVEFASVSHLSVGPSTIQVQVEPGTTRSAAPGTYALMHVKSRGRLNLGPGVYFVRRFVLEPGATLSVPAGVTLVAQDELIVRGTVTSPMALAFLGTTMVPIESAFVGTVLAPRATLKITRNFRGNAVGSYLLLEPDIDVICDPTAPRPAILFP